MSKLIIPILLIMAATAGASDIKIEWDASDGAGVTHYEVYARSADQPYDYNKPVCRVPSDVLTCKIPMSDDEPRHFVARAIVITEVSANSNEVETPLPPYSTNAGRTIYHVPGCRYYNPERGVQEPVGRPCKICEGGIE